MAETARMNSTKSVRKQPAKTAAAAAAAANAAVAATNTTTTSVIHEPKIVNVPSNCTPAGPAFSITNLTPVVMQQGLQPQQPQPVQMMQQQPQPQAMTNMTGPMATMQVSLPLPALSTANSKDRQILLDEILKREPVEPARSPKQLFVSEFLAITKNKKKKQTDAKAAWKALDKKELEIYTELKQKRDEEEESQNESSDSES